MSKYVYDGEVQRVSDVLNCFLATMNVMIQDFEAQSAEIGDVAVRACLVYAESPPVWFCASLKLLPEYMGHAHHGMSVICDNLVLTLHHGRLLWLILLYPVHILNSKQTGLECSLRCLYLQTGFTPLHVAARCGNEEIIEELALEGGNLDQFDKVCRVQRQKSCRSLTKKNCSASNPVLLGSRYATPSVPSQFARCVGSKILLVQEMISYSKFTLKNLQVECTQSAK